MSISDNLFSVEIYLGGNFDLGPPKQYVNGSCARLEKVRPDEFYMSSIKEIMMECEYFEDYRVFCKLHESSVDDGYILINTDESLHDAFKEHQNLKKVVLYIEHLQEEHVVPEASEEHEIGFETIHTKDAFLDDRATNTNFGDPNSGNISDSDVVGALSSTPETAREHDHGEWTPTVDDINRPKLGMQFASLEEGKLFYYAYGKLGGFSIRKGSTNLDRKTRELITKYYVCSKQGESTAKVLQGETIKELPVGSTAGKKKRRRSVIRENCMAMIKFKKVENDMWEIVKFHEGHCHVLTSPRRQQFLNINRGVSSTQKSLIQIYDEANISTSQLVTVLKIQANGYENMGCTERDIRNHKRNVRKAMKETDAQIFLDNFARMKKINPSFFYDYKVDKDMKLTHVFWTDGLSRKAYHLFGDVVVFDTTYETNKYSLIFAPFTGVNHHRQSVNFGVGFLADEKSESFIWLFEKFLEAMGGKQPLAFITDQYPSIGNAVKVKLDKTKQRYCMWHILHKLSGKVGSELASNIKFHEDFKSCVYSSETIEEFKMRWNEVITTYHLGNNMWLKMMHGLRELWIPAFFKGTFLAGMRTTQRSESMNSFFSHFVSQRNSLVEFHTRFERALEHQRHNELKADHDTIYTRPKMKIKNSLEKQMSEIYTRANFHLFQDELLKSCVNCATKKIDEVEDVYFYIVQENKENKKLRSREVVYLQATKVAYCDCKMFEGEGLPCRHILAVLKNEFVDELSTHYIVRRWTKLATSAQIFDVEGNELCGTSSNITGINLSSLWDLLSECMHLAGYSNESFLHAMERGKNLRDDLLRMKENLGANLNHKKEKHFTEGNLPTTSNNDNVCIPDISKTKGSGKRLKGGKEKAMEQQEKNLKLCRTCNKYVDHDSRNCPEKKES